MSKFNHPETCYSHDENNNCTIIKWGDGGHYKTDYPAGKYTDDVVDELNSRFGITPNMRTAMETCSEAAQFNPLLDWEELYNKTLERIQELMQNKADIEQCYNELLMSVQEYRNDEKSRRRVEESLENFKFVLGIEGTDKKAIEQIKNAIEIIAEDAAEQQKRRKMAN